MENQGQGVNEQSHVQLPSVEQNQQNLVQNPPIFPKNQLILIGVLIFSILILGTYSVLISRAKTSKTKLVLSPSSTPIPASPTPITNLTSGWKTYANAKLGFSFKYPSELNISSSSGEFDKGLFLSFEKENEGMPPLDISLYTNSSDKEFQEELYKILKIKKSDDGYYKYSEISEKKLNSSTLYSYLESYDPDSHKLLIPGNPYYRLRATAMIRNIYYDFYYITDLDTLKEDREVFEQLLSNVQVSPGLETIDTSTWKTYITNTNKYSIKYPRDWTLT